MPSTPNFGQLSSTPHVNCSCSTSSTCSHDTLHALSDPTHQPANTSLSLSSVQPPQSHFYIKTYSTSSNCSSLNHLTKMSFSLNTPKKPASLPQYSLPTLPNSAGLTPPHLFKAISPQNVQDTPIKSPSAPPTQNSSTQRLLWPRSAISTPTSQSATQTPISNSSPPIPVSNPRLGSGHSKFTISSSFAGTKRFRRTTKDNLLHSFSKSPSLQTLL